MTKRLTSQLSDRFVRSSRGVGTIAAALALAACQPSAEKVAAQAAEAQQLLDAGQVDQAEKLINAAIRERDDVVPALLVQARVAIARGNRGLAYQAYNGAMSLEATNPEALMGVAQLGLGTGHIDEAEDAANKILTLQPEQPQALTVKALIAIVRKNMDAAGKLADRILARSPGDLGGLILKSRVQALSGDLPAAMATLQSGADRYTGSADFSMALAEMYRAQGNGAALLQELGRIRTLAPDNIPYRVDLADLLYRSGQKDAAREQVLALIEKPVSDAATIDQIVRLWYANDREAMTPDAIERASKSASLEARMAFARYFVATDRPAYAQALLRPLASGWSTDIAGLFAYANAAAGDPGAAAVAEKLLADDSSNGGALLVRVNRALAQRRPRPAIVDAQRVIADYPQWDEGHLALATAYGMLGDRVGIRRAFEQALKLRPQSLPLAQAYVQRLPAMGDPQRAVEVARRLALNSPGLPIAWQFYADTCVRLKGDDCRDESTAGLAAARTRYGLDPVPGTPAAISAIGRLN